MPAKPNTARDRLLITYHEQYPDHTIPEICSLIEQHHGIKTSPSTAYSAYVRLGIRHGDGESLAGAVRRARRVASSFDEKLAGLQAAAYRGLLGCPVVRPRFPSKWLFAPDAHSYIWDWGVTETMLERDGDADGIVMNELFNLDSFSHFRQTYRPDSLAEVEVVAAGVERMVRRFGRNGTVLSTSNHDVRFIKWASSHPRSDADVVETVAAAWAALLDRYIELRPTFVAGIRVQIGRAIFSHPDSYLAAQGQTAMNEGAKCRVQHHYLGLEPPFQFVAVGHPHRLNFLQWRGEQGFVSEAGCQCHVPRYVLEDTSSRPCVQFPIVNGYVVVQFCRNGDVDFTGTGVRFVKWADVPNVSDGSSIGNRGGVIHVSRERRRHGKRADTGKSGVQAGRGRSRTFAVGKQRRRSD